MSYEAEKDLSPFSDAPTGGRWLLAGISLFGILLLALLPWQTVPGSIGQVAMAGGWWAEPALASGITLGLTIIASSSAFLAARREPLLLWETGKVYGRILLIAACMVGSVLMMGVLGFALSILLFSTLVAAIGGFRGFRLVLIPLFTTIALVVMFRIGFSIWFPRPMLFNWIDLPSFLQGIL